MPLPSLLLLAALAPADASAPVEGPPAPSAVMVEDAGEVQGTWEIVSVFLGTDDHSSGYRGDRFVFVGTTFQAIKAGGNAFISVTFRVDAARYPPAIDIMAEEGQARLAIYRRTDDKLLWAWAVKGGPRPSSFDPAPGVMVWTLRRVKK
jgi:uncharacterized protein (TIGR03067 family)